MIRLIKRYDNRKLYDTQTSKTVNLSEIADMIRLGDEVQVIDSKGRDISPKILGQIFLQENIETKQLFLNKFLLQGLIQEGQNLESVIKKFLLGGIGFASMTQEKLEDLVNELVKRGEVAEDDRSRFLKDLMDKGSQKFHEVVDKVSTNIQTKEEEMSKEDRIKLLESQIADLTSELNGLKPASNNGQKEAKPSAKAAAEPVAQTPAKN